MCGISGFCNMPQHWQDTIEQMNKKMYYRGPDAEGVWATEDKSVVFGHRRLAILDLSENGIQPMLSRSERFVITYNGEIYNYKVIADRLLREKKVFAFRSGSDTEVILEAMEAYGIVETLCMCKGMFAIALFDRYERVLYLMRDRVGEKPLYYGFVNEGFIFSSEISAIQEIEGFNKAIDKEALRLYLQRGYIPAPYSIYQNIFKLEAGTVLMLKEPYTTYSISSYWSMKQVALYGQNHRFSGTEIEARIELERLLKNSIKEQMIADVPVGAFLSGGIDSSTIVALMQSLSIAKVKSFTIGFEDESYNEAPHAKAIAEYLGTDHTELYINENDAQSVIPMLPRIYGEPFADSSQIPTYLVSKLTKQKVCVSLSGDGGDELFCGYNLYQIISNIWNKIKYIPYPIRRTCGAIIQNTPLSMNTTLSKVGHYIQAKKLEQIYALTNTVNKRMEKILYNKGIAGPNDNKYIIDYLNETKENLMLNDLLIYHPDDILVKVDRSGMAVSLETRIPLLDKDIIEFAWTLPLQYKCIENDRKRILREVLYQYIPHELIDRPKRGFSIPIKKWLKQGELREWAENLLDNNRLQCQDVFNPYIVKKLWNSYIKYDKWEDSIWYILVFQDWYSYYIG